MRILLVSHEWEAITPGGAQRSAAALARGLSNSGTNRVSVASAIRDDSDAPADYLSYATAPIIQKLVVSSTDTEFFSWNEPAFAQNWTEVLNELQPHVVHLHHYYQVGIELPALITRSLPAAGIVMTLHEYLGICLRSGQMVNDQGQLCLSSSTPKCGACLDWPQARTAARSDYIRRGFSFVDEFITPSDFARNRYMDWGLDPRNVHTIPNALELELSDGKRPLSNTAGMRLAYIGQHTPYKGLEVLLDAIATLSARDPHAVSRLDIFGGGAATFGPEFEDRLDRAQSRVSSLARFRGPYNQVNLPGILDSVDAIVVPSTWWENSPVVIEEALARRVPVICSDIGGMAEKVRDGIDGWHFQAGSANSLADVIARVPSLLPLPAVSMRLPLAMAEVTDLHTEIYLAAIAAGRLRADRAGINAASDP